MESGCRRVSRVFSIRARELSFSLFYLWHPMIITDTPSPSMISYPNYKFTFPVKALGMYARKYGNPKVL